MKDCIHALAVCIQHESENSQLIYWKGDIPQRKDDTYTIFNYCPFCGIELGEDDEKK